MFDIASVNKTLAELEEELQRIKTAREMLDMSIGISKDTMDIDKDLIRRSEQLTGSAQNLLKNIDKVDFPSRLDKIDVTISGIIPSVQNIISRLESNERNLKDTIRSTENNIKNEVDSRIMVLKNEVISAFTDMNTKIEKAQKKNMWFFVILVILQLAVLATLLFLK